MATDPFVEPKDLASLGPVRYIDTRSEEAFKAGSAPNAAHVRTGVWDLALKAPAVRFSNTEFWEYTINEVGLGGSRIGVVFDDGTMVPAARVWFVLQLYGAKVRIVNGGWPAMRRVGALRLGAPEALESFAVRTGVGPVGVVAKHDLRDQLPGQARVFDTRTAKEYSGEDQRQNPRGGHLPGAINLPHADLITRTGVRSARWLRKTMTEAGFQSDDRIVTHCEGGGRAALAAAAAVRAGFEHVQVYYHSFSEWARDPTCPVVRD
jgi:thiosulfate/3-mercaptopyruvate sulfurtransferase